MAQEKKATPKKKSGGSKIWKIYTAGKTKNKSCPKCGKGVFMAGHKDRNTCGKCGYTEFLRK
jgi:small subunit ribosomal protein S27Ae